MAKGERWKARYIRTKSGRPFAFAGLWESWSRNGEVIQSCTILTTGADDFLQEIHHGMPVMMAPEVYDLWRDPEVREPDQLLTLLAPYPGSLLEGQQPSNNEPGWTERAARTRDAVYSRRL